MELPCWSLQSLRICPRLLTRIMQLQLVVDVRPFICLRPLCWPRFFLPQMATIATVQAWVLWSLQVSFFVANIFHLVDNVDYTLFACGNVSDPLKLYKDNGSKPDLVTKIDRFDFRSKIIPSIVVRITFYLPMIGIVSCLCFRKFTDIASNCSNWYVSALLPRIACFWRVFIVVLQLSPLVGQALST